MGTQFGITEAGKLARIPLLAHIRNRIKQLEQATKGIVALQFSDHPDGLSMLLRIYVPASGKEYPYPDIILPFELVDQSLEISRVDVLFDAIHDALNSIQVVQDKSGGLIIH